MATRPLPKTLTDASCPAFSSRTTAATTSSSDRAVCTRSLIRSSVGARRRLCASSRTSSEKSTAAATAASTTSLPGDGSYIRTIACDHVTQLRCMRPRHPEQLRDDQHRQRFGVVADHVEARWVDGREQLRGELAHPRSEPLDVAAVERRRDRTAEPGVLGRLVLHHLVAV